MFTKLLLLEEEGAVEGVGEGVVQELEAVEDLDGAAALDADHAAVDARGQVEGRAPGLLRLDACVVVGDVDDHQRVELEGQPAARRRRHRPSSSPHLLSPEKVPAAMSPAPEKRRGLVVRRPIDPSPNLGFVVIIMNQPGRERGPGVPLPWPLCIIDPKY